MEKEIIHIKEPFYTAGKLYGWIGKSIGVGIDLRKIIGDGNLFIRVGNSEKVWCVDKEIARQFIKNHKSYYDAKGIKLGVLAWNLFKEKKDISENQKELL